MFFSWRSDKYAHAAFKYHFCVYQIAWLLLIFPHFPARMHMSACRYIVSPFSQAKSLDMFLFNMLNG